MDDYKIIVEQEHQTVMAHYEVEAKSAAQAVAGDVGRLVGADG